MPVRAGDDDRSYIGIDLGGTNLRFALVDGEGTVRARLRSPTERHLGWAALRGHLLTGITSLVQTSADAGLRATAIGAGVPGLVSPEGIVHAAVNLPFLVGRNIRAELETATGLPAVVVNDANAIAYGEKAYGAGRPFESFLMFTLGTGIGSGLVLAGRLWTGRDGVAAECGHATVEPEGVRCECGNNGCLEQYASASAIVREVLRRRGDHSGSSLSRLNAAAVTAELIAREAARGDELAIEVFARAGYYLGLTAATVLNLLNVEAILLGGGVAESFPLIAGSMRVEMDRRAFPVVTKGVEILKGVLGDDAGLLGSAALAAEITIATGSE